MGFLMQFWPVISLGLHAVAVWVCWSLRQLAKEEVEKIAESWKARLDGAVAELRTADQEICEDVEDHEGRITRLEEGLKALPQRADFERLEAEVHKVGVEVGRMAATQAAHRDSNVQAQQAVDRLYQYLLTTRVG